MLEIPLADHRLQLLADRALYWPERQALVVADIHLGKGASFREQGLPLPSGGTRTDLTRLSQLIHTYQPDHLVVLGDLIHGGARQPQQDWIAQAQAWRAQHAELQLHWVIGNHDRAPEELAHRWRAKLIVEGASWSSLQLWHHPPEDLSTPSLGGHWHPVVFLRPGARQRLRLPVFWQEGLRLILPAFGSLTGGHPVDPSPTSRLWACAEQNIIALEGLHAAPRRARASRRKT